MAALIWKIPSFSDQEKKLLFAGYSRKECNISLFDDIINLLSQYFSHQSFTLNDVKQTTFGCKFHSPVFSFKSFKWMLTILPGGFNDQNRGSFIFAVSLCRSPPSIILKCTPTLTLEETDTQYSFANMRLNTDAGFCWPANTVPIDDIQKQNSLTFKCQIDSLLVQNSVTDEIIPNYVPRSSLSYSVPICLPVATYEWIISDSVTIQKLQSSLPQITSPAFEIGIFKFYLTFEVDTNGFDTNLQINLASSPWIGRESSYNILTKFKVVWAYNTLHKTNKNGYLYSTFDFHHYALNSNIMHIMDSSKIRDLSILSFYVEIIIVDVYKKSDTHALKNYVEENVCNHAKATALATTTYEWKISDIIKNTKNATTFNSPVFAAYHYKWMLKCVVQNDRIYFGLALQSVNREATTILTEFTLCLIELGVQHRFLERFQQQKHYVLSDTTNAFGFTLPTSDILHLNQLSFSVDICVLYTSNMYRRDVNKSQIPKNVFALPIIMQEWKISDKQILQSIKSASGGFGFATPLFHSKGLYWYMILYPNGTPNAMDGKVSVWIKLVNHKISILERERTVCNFRAKISFMEFDVISEICEHRNCVGKSDWCLKKQDLQKLNSITLQAEITLIDEFKWRAENLINLRDCFSRNISVNVPVKLSILPSRNFTWNISSDNLEKIKFCEPGISFDSNEFEMYTMKWVIKFCPKEELSILENNDIEESRVSIENIKLPSGLRISMRYTLIVADFQFINDAMIYSSEYSPAYTEQQFLFNELTEQKELSISLRLELIDVFKESTNVTQKFLNVDDDEKKEKSQILSLCENNNMKSMEKDALIKQFLDMKQQINGLNTKMNIIEIMLGIVIVLLGIVLCCVVQWNEK